MLSICVLRLETAMPSPAKGAHSENSDVFSVMEEIIVALNSP
jgi:hypothetical protein